MQHFVVSLFATAFPKKEHSCWHSCPLKTMAIMFRVSSGAEHCSMQQYNTPLPTVMRNCNVYVEAIIIMSGTIQRTCCKFHIISPLVKQLQTSGKKQWSTLGFAQLRCSFEACHYSRTCEINRKLSHWKS